MSEYFCVAFPGGDERPLYCLPSRTVEQVRALYPAALSVTEISKASFMLLCERLHRVVMV